MRVFILISLLFTTLHLSAQTDSSPCVAGQSFRIVVLGSSTAAGTGPSTSDSAWVNRYRDYVKSINPNNEVINLAVGGYTTYKLMPTGWTQPSGRPTPDTARNITKALSLNPDAIIVNMPSNDVSNGFGTVEQMFNFDSLYSMANNNGVAIWICTTQPKTSLSAANKAIQVEVRDSVFAHFGQYAIDFWNGIADSNSSILPQYNADGTHLNADGHSVLLSRVQDEQILGNLYTTPPSVDYGITHIWGLDTIACGNGSSVVALEVTSFGQATTTSLDAELWVSRDNSTPALYSESISMSGTCTQDTVYLTVDLSETGLYSFTAITNTVSDTFPLNDSSFAEKLLLGTPDITPVGDTGCINETLTLSVSVNGTDVPQWYNDQLDSISASTTYTTPALSSPTTYYVDAYRPDVAITDSFSTATNTSTDWFGQMFDIVAHQTISLDSLSLLIATTGTQAIEVYNKQGSYIGSEADAQAWTLWTTDTFNIAASGDLVTIPLPSNTTLQAGDTLGIYVNMVTSSAQLWYYNSGSAQTQGDQALSILAGTGISNGFTQSYYPRLFRGKVYYTTTTQTNGLCRSPLMPVTALIDTQQVQIIAADTIELDDVLTLDLNMTGTPTWSTGSTDNSLTLDSLNGFVLGSNTYWVDMESVYGCLSNDTVTVIVLEPSDTVSSIADLVTEDISIYPNPVNSKCTISYPTNIDQLYLWSLDGKLLNSWTIGTTTANIDLSDMANGTYLLGIMNSQGQLGLQKLVVQH